MSLPTREQIAEVIWNTGTQPDEPSWDEANAWWRGEYLKKADAVLALISADMDDNQKVKP